MDLNLYAANHPDRPAHIMASTGEATTYSTLNARSIQFARLLQSRGLVPGDHIALHMENNPRFFEVVWGALRSGLYYTAVEADYPAEMVTFIVKDCGAKAFISSYAQRETATTVRDQTENLMLTLMVDGVTPG